MLLASSVPCDQLRNAKAGGGNAPREFSPRQHIFQFQQQDLTGEEFDTSLQPRVDQSRRRVIPQQSGNDGIGVKHQPHVLRGRDVPRARP